MLIWMLPATGQTASEKGFAPSSGAMALSGQEFHCHTGYTLAQCQQDILQLKNMLIRYRVEGLGPWTWVLVRSEDWRPITQSLRLNPDSPAFTALEQRETFLEEALFMHDPLRVAELMKEWQLPMSKLLDLAVTHELGHALCDEQNEAVADRFGEDLRRGQHPNCQASQIAKKKVEAGQSTRVSGSAGR
jgi:hypothetical protein